MKILILEDDPNRIEKFKQWFIGCTLIITHIAEEANNFIEKEQFDYIFLDHDLGETHYQTWQDPTILYEDTGLNTAKFLGNNPHLNSNAQIIIHSLNPYGRMNMKNAMPNRNVLIAPFISLLGHLIVRHDDELFRS